MALLGKLKTKESRWKVLDKKSQRNGLCHTVFSTNGDSFIGEWKDGLKHGQGNQVWKKRRLMFKGGWQQGKRHGLGTLFKLEPSTGKYELVYSGSWEDDKKNGYGKYIFSSSSSFEGVWVDNMRSGWGRMCYENGDVYEGQWLMDKPHGLGVLLLKNGDRFEGVMKEGKKNGQGCFFFKEKDQVLKGFWEDDMMRHGALYDVKMETAESSAAESSSFWKALEILEETDFWALFV